MFFSNYQISRNFSSTFTEKKKIGGPPQFKPMLLKSWQYSLALSCFQLIAIFFPAVAPAGNPAPLQGSWAPSLPRSLSSAT